MFTITPFSQNKIIVPDQFSTVQSAIDSSFGADTIFIRNGTYNENVILRDKIVLIGEDNIKTIINGDNKKPCIIGSHYSVVTNLFITNGSVGIECNGTRPIIKRNIIYKNKVAGIHALASLPQIENNIIEKNGHYGIYLESVRSATSFIVQNVIVSHKKNGVYCANYTAVQIKNNIICNNKKQGVFCEKNAGKCRVVYNNYFRNSSPCNKHVVFNQSNVLTDPLFESPGYPNFNYLTKSYSPCKKRGENNMDIGLLEIELKN